MRRFLTRERVPPTDPGDRLPSREDIQKRARFWLEGRPMDPSAAREDVRDLLALDPVAIDGT